MNHVMGQGAGERECHESATVGKGGRARSQRVSRVASRSGEAKGQREGGPAGLRQQGAGSVWSGRACGESAVPAATVKFQARADRSLWLSVVPTVARSGCARSPLGELSLLQ